MAVEPVIPDAPFKFGREFLKATEEDLKEMIRLLDENDFTQATLETYTEWVLGQFGFSASVKTIIDDMEDPWDGK